MLAGLADLGLGVVGERQQRVEDDHQSAVLPRRLRLDQKQRTS